MINNTKLLSTLVGNDTVLTTNVDITDLVTKSNGGSISGVVTTINDLIIDGSQRIIDENQPPKFIVQNGAQFELSGSDLNLYGSNFTQVSIRKKTTGEELPQRVYNLSPYNSFIQAEEAFSGGDFDKSYGVACTGYKGFCILAMNNAEKTIKLSGDPNTPSLAGNGTTISDDIFYTIDNCGPKKGWWSFMYGSNATLDSKGISVDSIVSGNISSFTIQVNPENILIDITDENQAINTWNNLDENGFYFVPDISKNSEFERNVIINDLYDGIRDDAPIIGNAKIGCFNGTHAEGGSSKAIGKYAHAEGRGCIAEGRYSHAEGSFCHARQIYSHVEGSATFANGSASHAEGYKSIAIGAGSHAEGGDSTKTTGSSIVGGYAYGNGSHAEGCGTIANGIGSHAEGIKTNAIGIGSHVEGYNNYAYGEYSHAEGDGGCYAGSMAFKIVNSNQTLSTLTLDSLTCDAGPISNIPNNSWIMIFQRAKTDGNVNATFKTEFYGITDEENNVISVSYVPTFSNYSNATVQFPKYPQYGTQMIGSGAHSHGFNCHSMEDSTAFGCNNYALGRYSFAIGNANKTDYMGVAIGSGNGAFGKHSIAMGGNGSADDSAPDSNTQVYSAKAFGWSGDGKYIVEGEDRNGTFNINPVGNEYGVWIGEKTIGDMIDQSLKTIFQSIQAVQPELQGNIVYTLNGREYVPSSASNTTFIYPEEKRNALIKIIDLYSGYTVFGDSALNGCNNLTAIDIPEGITALGNNALSGCTKLTKVTLPSTLKSLGSNCFRGTKITELVLPDGLTSIATAGVGYLAITTLSVPDSVISLTSSSFGSNTSLTSINYPPHVTIGATASIFYNDYKLKEISAYSININQLSNKIISWMGKTTYAMNQVSVFGSDGTMIFDKQKTDKTVTPTQDNYTFTFI